MGLEGNSGYKVLLRFITTPFLAAPPHEIVTKERVNYPPFLAIIKRKVPPPPSPLKYTHNSYI